MIPYRGILVPTDFGEAAREALRHAVAIGRQFDSKITLLRAYGLPMTDYGEAVEWPVAEIEKQAQKALDDGLAALRRDYPNADGMVACGEIHRQILDAAEARKVDLIVMGTHGRTGLSRVLLGSVAEKVVRLSPVPVLTVTSQPAK